jgi:hypothetical protein
VLPINSGRDPVSQFLKRTLIHHPTEERYYLDSDLAIGATIDVFGRQFFLYDADGFTRLFLDNKYGPRDWTPIDVDEHLQAVKYEQKISPHNGWGDEEDSLGFCLSLHPKPPKKDVAKMISKDGKLLRLAAKLKTRLPQDAAREFVIVYYLADDTIAVFEKPRRNSGFWEGKFIQRGKYKNVDNNDEYFKSDDFEIGKEDVINSFRFSTYEADEYAFSYMESEADDFNQADLYAVIMNLKQKEIDLAKLRDEF